MTFASLTNTAEFIFSSISPEGTTSFQQAFSNDACFAHDACPGGQMMRALHMMPFASLTNTAEFIFSSISPEGTTSFQQAFSNDACFAHDACPGGQMMRALHMMPFASLTNTAEFIFSSISPEGTTSLVKRHHSLISPARGGIIKKAGFFISLLF